MLINLSNHPSGRWNLKQLEMAREFGDIRDIPFPHIDPEASGEALQQLAANYLVDIEDYAAKSENAVVVHIMGELTFCFSLVKQLQNKGIRCIASTTERKVLEEKDGRKTTQFRFVRFRDYV